MRENILQRNDKNLKLDNYFPEPKLAKYTLEVFVFLLLLLFTFFVFGFKSSISDFKDIFMGSAEH